MAKIRVQFGVQSEKVEEIQESDLSSWEAKGWKLLDKESMKKLSPKTLDQVENMEMMEGWEDELNSKAESNHAPASTGPDGIFGPDSEEAQGAPRIQKRK